MPKSVQIVLFSHSGRPEFQVTNMILELVMLLSQRGSDVSYSVRARDSVLPRARNAACADFLAGGKDVLLMIDDDNYCAASDLVRLIDAPGDVVGAAIRVKDDRPLWNVGWLPDRDIAPDEFGQVEVAHVGTGIFRMSREALARVAQVLEGEPSGSYADPNCAGGRSPRIFFYGFEDGHFYGEDVTFCMNWRVVAGGAVHILPDIETHHIGARDFCGSVQGWLAAQTPKLTIVSDKGDSQSDVVNSFSSAGEDRLRADLEALGVAP